MTAVALRDDVAANPNGGTEMAPPVIETEELCKVYQMGDTSVHALADVSIRVERGEMVAIVGPSGSGKSTLMAILGALDQPTSGRYRLDGVEIGSMSSDTLSDIRSSRIGFVFQKFNLLARSTALDNVALPLVYAGVPTGERRERAQWALETVDLADRMRHRPNELSGGQQQRVAIARALVNNPSLILADEPTGNLDSKTGEDILTLFQRLHTAQGITLVVVTHAPDIASRAGRIFTMRDGRVVDAVETH